MRKSGILLTALIVACVFIYTLITNFNTKDSNMVTAHVDNPTESVKLAKAERAYKEYCAGCHGDQLEAFTDRRWTYGNKPENIEFSITTGYPNKGMPGFDEAFTPDEINGLVAYILNGIENVKQYDFEDKIKVGEIIESDDLNYKLEKITDGLDSPWGMAFLKNNEMLISEKSGALYLRKPDGKLIKVSGVPEVNAHGQGGLMDIQLHPEFRTNGILYLSFSKSKMIDGEELTTTAVLKATLKENALINSKIIFEALPYLPTRHHYGSRMEFDKNGYLFISVGDRGRRETNPQSISNFCGKIHRIKEDGSIPEDNPFYNTSGAIQSIYSYGHRNPQGLVIDHETGIIWEHEHGPKGGDEINIIEPAKNYGWPVISYGINYNGTTFTNETDKDGMEQPAMYWVPSIAPCGMALVTGDKYPAWKGNLLVGSLRFKYLNRCAIEGNKVVKQEMLLKNIGRLRNVEMGNDGYIYVAVERPGIIYKIIPL